MKLCVVLIYILFLCFSSVSVAFAQTITPSPQPTGEINDTQSGSNILNSFISGFDWISSGLIFYTPSLLDTTIKMQDGTELTGMGNFRSIFYDIAVPLFVVITSFVAFRHISNDNAVQLQQFFKRLVLIVALFIITPAILSYSIQFTNLLNEKIIASNSYNLSTLVNDFLGGFVTIPIFQQLFGAPIALPTWNTILQTIILVISIGFLLIGFIYIVFQAVIRFIGLLVLSVIFPVVLPFALSEQTENIVNTYFRTWFSFLIQQPAFVLGFAIVSAILTSISQAHNNSIGTLFVYSGALIFLGGINVFIGRIFGEGWSLLATNMQSMVIARNVNNSATGIARNEKVKRLPAYAGGAINKTKNSFLKGVTKFLGEKRQERDTRQTKLKIETQNRTLIDKLAKSPSSDKPGQTTSNDTTYNTHSATKSDNSKTSSPRQNSKDDKRTSNRLSDQANNTTDIQAPPKGSSISTRRLSTRRPIATKRPTKSVGSTRNEISGNKVPRRKVSI